MYCLEKNFFEFLIFLLYFPGGVLEFRNPAYSTTIRHVKGELQTLRCPANNFCRIEWYRNDTFDPYPWGLQGAGPELQQNGQYLVFKTPSCDADVDGNYTCVVYNETHRIERTIRMISISKLL